MAFDKKQGFYWPCIPLLDFNVKIVFNWGRKHSSVTKLNVDHVHSRIFQNSPKYRT